MSKPLPLGNEKFNTLDAPASGKPPSEFWRDVWNRKAAQLQQESCSVIDGYHFISESQYNALVRHVADPLNLAPGMTLLECGCGSGAFLRAVELACPGLILSGVDYAEAMLEIAQERMPHIRFLIGDIRNLYGLPDESFEVTAASSGAFHRAPDRLRPGS